MGWKDAARGWDLQSEAFADTLRRAVESNQAMAEEMARRLEETACDAQVVREWLLQESAKVTELLERVLQVQRKQVKGLIRAGERSYWFSKKEVGELIELLDTQDAASASTSAVSESVPQQRQHSGLKRTAAGDSPRAIKKPRRSDRLAAKA